MMSRMMRSLPLTLCFVLLACNSGCEPTPPASRPVAAIRPPATVAATAPKTAPAPVRMTKPPVLGPMGPAIVILPQHFDEPNIRVRLTDPSDHPPAIARGKYRGRVDVLRLADNKYIAVNVLPLDDYLQGVLAKELYGSWDPEAYRAQAIVARTFALYSMLVEGRSKQWDVSDDESSQMYGGIKGETAKARDAVQETRGQVLTATVDGKSGIFCARYSACSGGATQDPHDAWGDSTVGPLMARTVGNVDSNCDKFIWNRDFVVSRADATRCVQNWGQRNDFPYLASLGMLQSVKIHKRNPATGRPTELLLADAAGRSAPMRAEEFRLALMNDPWGRAPKPFSSFCEIRAEGDNFILYNGRGYGHGIGMSQWGAQSLAKSGHSHTQILAFFYPGAALAQLW